MNHLCELMYFYWKISYIRNFLDTAPGQPGGPRLYQAGPGTPWPHAGYGAGPTLLRWGGAKKKFGGGGELPPPLPHAGYGPDCIQSTVNRLYCALWHSKLILNIRVYNTVHSGTRRTVEYILYSVKYN